MESKDVLIEQVLNNSDINIWMLSYDFKKIPKYNFDLFSRQEIEVFQTFFSEKRKMEFYYTRVLLKHIEPADQIEYDSNRKPHIKDGYLSISHARNKIVISKTKNNIVGVDIEYFNPKIFRIRKKFLHDNEIKSHNLEDIFELTVIWSLKEAIYKLENIAGLRFKEDIYVKSIQHLGQVEVQLEKSVHTYSYGLITFDDFVITYCYR